MNNIFKDRINKLQKQIENGQSILLSSSSDVAYFTNFNFLVPEEREALAFITKNSINLIYTSFSPIDNFSYINYFKGSFPNQLADHLEQIVKKEKINKILIDDETLFVAELNAIRDKLETIKINNFDINLVRNFRNIKEQVEIKKINKACAVTALVAKEIKNELCIGITELEVKKKISRLFESHGANELAFPTIVAFGTNSALPHHQPSNKKLENNMVVLIDMGAKISRYCSDITRTFWFGKNPSEKFLEIESIVHDAYQATFEKLKNRQINSQSPKDENSTTSKKSQANLNSKPSTIEAKDLDNTARVLISNKGYSKNFTHTTGHGLGLSIHEQPSISWSNPTQIFPNMTITIEPGIYLEGEFGYRYENTVLVTENGAVELTNSTNQEPT